MDNQTNKSTIPIGHYIQSEKDLDKKIYRYTDLDFLLKLLSGNFTVTKKCTWDDVWEAGITKFYFKFAIVDQTPNPPTKDYKNKVVDDIRANKNILASCWTLEEYEDFLMWNNYTKGDYGVRIETTIQDIYHSMRNYAPTIIGGRIHYKKHLIPNGFWDGIYTKSIVYQSEKEFRFYFGLAPDKCQKHHFIKIDPETLNLKIRFNPLISNDSFEFIKEALYQKFPYLKKSNSISKSKIELTKQKK